MPNSFSFIHRPMPLAASEFDSGAKWLPTFRQRAHVPQHAFAGGIPCLRQYSARNSL